MQDITTIFDLSSTHASVYKNTTKTTANWFQLDFNQWAVSWILPSPILMKPWRSNSWKAEFSTDYLYILNNEEIDNYHKY